MITNFGQIVRIQFKKEKQDGERFNKTFAFTHRFWTILENKNLEKFPN